MRSMIGWVVQLDGWCGSGLYGLMGCAIGMVLRLDMRYYTFISILAFYNNTIVTVCKYLSECISSHTKQ